jgi:hypothetical protein
MPPVASGAQEVSHDAANPKKNQAAGQDQAAPPHRLLPNSGQHGREFWELILRSNP